MTPIIAFQDPKLKKFIPYLPPAVEAAIALNRWSRELLRAADVAIAQTAPSTGKEWLLADYHSSGIPDKLALLNAKWVEGDEAIALLTEEAIAQLGGHSRQYITAPARRILERYQFAAAGGWVAWGSTLEGDRGKVAYFKPTQPREELKFHGFGQQPTKTGKKIKYETPAKQPATPLLPFVDEGTAAQIYRRYKVEPNQGESFWKVIQRCNIPIAITEGLKKALSLITNGIPAIALRGVSCWHPKSAEGMFGKHHEVYEAIAQFATKDRQFFICFDQDEKPQTARNVAIQVEQLGRSLVSLGCQVAIPTWESSEAKGIDDLLVNQATPQLFLETLLQSAPDFESWSRDRFRAKLLCLTNDLNTLKIVPERATEGSEVDPYLPSLPPLQRGSIHLLNPSMGCGKTERLGVDWVKPWAAADGIALVLSPMNSLGQQTASRWGLPHIHDYDLSKKDQFDVLMGDADQAGGLVLCPDSLHRIPDWLWKGDRPPLIVLDEANQVVDHIVQGGTLQGRQSAIIEQLAAILEYAGTNGAIALSEAGIYPRTLDWIKRLSRCDRFRMFDHTTNSSPWEVELHTGQISGYFQQILEDLWDGKKLFFVTASQQAGKRLERLIKRTFSDCRTVLRIDSETNESNAFDSFWSDPNQYLRRNGIPDILILSPSGKSGVSITVPGFDKVCGFFTCHHPDMWMQQLGRYRPPVPRSIFALQRIAAGGGDEGLLYPSLIWKKQAANLKGFEKIFGSAEAIALVEGAEQGQECDRLLEIQSACQQFYAENAAAIGTQKAFPVDYLKQRLEVAGHRIVQQAIAQKNPDVAAELREIREEIEREEAAELAAVEVGSAHTTEWARRTLEGLNVSRGDRLRAEKVILRDLFPGVLFDDPEQCYQAITHDYGEMKRGVQLQARVMNLEASHRLDSEAFQKVQEQAIKMPHRFPKSHLKALLLEQVGILALLDGKPYTGEEERLLRIKKAALHWRQEIKYWLALEIDQSQTAIAIANKLLRRLGLNAVTLCRVGGRGQQRRVYGIPGLWEPTRLELLRAAITKLGGDPAMVTDQPPETYTEVVTAAEQRRRRPEEIPQVPAEELERIGIDLDRDDLCKNIAAA